MALIVALAEPDVATPRQSERISAAKQPLPPRLALLARSLAAPAETVGAGQTTIDLFGFCCQLSY